MSGYTATGLAVAICDGCDRHLIADASFDRADFLDFLDFHGWIVDGLIACPDCAEQLTATTLSGAAA